jgi:hypothetical protein
MAAQSPSIHHGHGPMPVHLQALPYNATCQVSHAHSAVIREQKETPRKE